MEPVDVLVKSELKPGNTWPKAEAIRSLQRLARSCRARTQLLANQSHEERTVFGLRGHFGTQGTPRIESRNPTWWWDDCES